MQALTLGCIRKNKRMFQMINLPIIETVSPERKRKISSSKFSRLNHKISFRNFHTFNGIHSCSMGMVHHCFVVSKKNVISRTMYSSKATRIMLRCVPSVKNSRMYAMYNCNAAENKSTDPQGDINNPTVTKNGVSFRHSEVHRTRCIQCDCTKKVCPHLCDSINDRKAIANLTSSNSAPTNGDSILVENVSPTLMNGKQGPQHARVYTKAHTTSKTKEFHSSTQKMHNEPNFIPTLIKDADDN